MKIDLFSDTNVNPSQAMRQAMASAIVGNEVAGEDPTINELLVRVCELLGKPAATFMPSGTMCNGIAYRVFCGAGDRIIFADNAHALNMASGLPAGLVGAMPEVINTERGIFTATQLEKAIGKNHGYNVAKAKLVSIEQTTNLGAGAIWPLKQLHAVSDTAHQRGLTCHMDGARLLNACVATGISAADYCLKVDSIWIDFAKGLGAPMGAVLVGSEDFIEQAWYYKFQQGGTMHQAGILGAACLYALNHNVERLAEDHQNAKQLAEYVGNIAKLHLKFAVETNIVMITVEEPLSANKIADALRQQGIRLLAIDDHTLRAIIHMDISATDIETVAASLEQTVSELYR